MFVGPWLCFLAVGFCLAYGADAADSGDWNAAWLGLALSWVNLIFAARYFGGRVS